MEQIDNKNYVNIMSSSEEKAKNNAGKVVIHTMPKRYMASLPASSHAKSTGVLILILGFLFLILALMLLYFYVFKKEPVIEISQEENFINFEKDIQDQKTNNHTKSDQNNNIQDNSAPSIIASSSQSSAATIATTTNTEKHLHKIDASNPNNQYLAPNDSDKDGLSDLEELLLGSSPNSEDTDGDGFGDMSEVLNLYDPTSRGVLIDSLNVEKYLNEEYDFSIFVSSLWTVDAISGNDSLIVSLGKDQYIQIISQNNTSNQSIEEWYMDLFEVDEILDEQVFKKGNWNGIINESKLTVYLEHPSKKYFITLNYEIGSDNTLYYKNIFDMMLQSISVIDG